MIRSMRFEVMISLPLKLIVLARLLRAQSDDVSRYWLGLGTSFQVRTLESRPGGRN